MRQFTEAVEQAVASQNWFGALFIALALPDICASLETPDESVGRRYRRWFDQNLARHFGDLLSADECYYFRCQCLHQGLATYSRSTGRAIQFTPPVPRALIHGNWIDGALQLQIDLFCLAMSNAVRSWAAGVQTEPDVQQRMAELITIRRWI